MRTLIVAALLFTAAGCRKAADDAQAKVAPVKGAPAADRDTWTHKDLAEFLASRGVKTKVDGILGYGGRPTARLRQQNDSGDESQRSRYLEVVLCADEKDSKDVAGIGREGSFAWGRFAFIDGTPDLLRKAREMLP